MLREAEVSLSQGLTVGKVCCRLEISEQNYYRWRIQYVGMKISQAKRMKELERENGRLKKAVAELTLDKLIFSNIKMWYKKWGQVRTDSHVCSGRHIPAQLPGIYDRRHSGGTLPLYCHGHCLE
jgi:hypothetical protein